MLVIICMLFVKSTGGHIYDGKFTFTHRFCFGIRRYLGTIRWSFANILGKNAAGTQKCSPDVNLEDVSVRKKNKLISGFFSNHANLLDKLVTQP